MENLGSKKVTRRESMIHHRLRNLWFLLLLNKTMKTLLVWRVLANKSQIKMKI